MAWAKHEFYLDTPEKDGQALRVHLESVMRQTKKRPVELDGPPAPQGALHVWGWFRDLQAERWSSGYGPQPLTSTQIKDWARMNRVWLRQWEYRAIRRLCAEDRIQWSTRAERDRKNKQPTIGSTSGYTIGQRR